MNKIAKDILNKLNESGNDAYIVGGYVRDLLLGNESNDIDICTNAKMKDVVSLFNGKVNDYGSLNIKTSEYNIDITTFREEYSYFKRKPTDIIYISDLANDLKRRDFTINTICLDVNDKVIDYLNGVQDLNKGIIRMVGDPLKKIQDDPLRILRAIRFATILDFSIEEELNKVIIENSSLVNSLSSYRIKEEISKILLSQNYQKGLDLIKKYGIDKLLNITYRSVVYTADLCGMWAQIDYPSDFPFTKNEKNTILKIHEILSFGSINNETLYKYGLYLCLVAGEILGIDTEAIHEIHKNLPIYMRNDLNITYLEIIEILGIKPCKAAKEIENHLIYAVLNGNLENSNEIIKKYLINNKERWNKYE